MSKSKELAIVNEKDLELLKELYPVETGSFNKIFLPRLSFISQDKTEGKGKAMKVIAEAGTFLEERQTEELNEDGKKIWEKKELGSSIEGIILYHRHQLSFYDDETEEYASTPVYDSADEVLPLFQAKKEIERGTPKELKAKYEFTDKDGKKKSKLKDNRILYVLVGEELFQLNLHGSSMFSFLKYARSINPPTVLTKFSSEPQEKGTIAWNMMTFVPIRKLNGLEIADVVQKVKDIRFAIQAEKGITQEVVKEDASMEEDALDKLMNEKE